MKDRRFTDWVPVLIFAVCWGVVPALPAISTGQLLGHPWTDLYPSVWGMWWFASEQAYVIPTVLPMFAEGLGAPDGIPFFYSSPLHGALATPLLSSFSLITTWNILTIAARIGTVLAGYIAAKAWGLSSRGSLVAAVLFGCSPFFHGYAVEGIVEGVDGWPLALWLWAVATKRKLLSALFFGLTIISSFYMAATAMVLALFIGPRCWVGVAGGLLLSTPFLYGFSSSFMGDSSVAPEVRRSMGSSIGLWEPALFTEGIQPFAKSSWIGFTAGFLCLVSGIKHRRVAVVGIIFWLLSLGVGPVYSLPLFSEIRFPYRFHAGTLVVMAYLVGRWIDDLAPSSRLYGKHTFIAGLLILEGMVLGPVETIIPSASGDIDEVHNMTSGAIVLDIPGPVAMPPNVRNPSRVRARDFLFGQTLNGTRSPWIPDFNSIGIVSTEHPDLEIVRQLDPLVSGETPTSLPTLSWVDGIIIHPSQLGDRTETIEALLNASGWRHIEGEFPDSVLYTRP